MKIYTRTGDSGETGFIGGRVTKASAMIELLGELDELNALLGVSVTWLKESSIYELEFVISACEHVQDFMFRLGALVADRDVKKIDSMKFAKLAKSEVKIVEKVIDTLDIKLPELKNFILPGGSRAGSHLHLTRAVCRRVERAMVKYLDEQSGEYAENIDAAQTYLNRLSDFLFVAARYTNQTLKVQDTVWKLA